jgi:hypothetical protein
VGNRSALGLCTREDYYRHDSFKGLVVLFVYVFDIDHQPKMSAGLSQSFHKLGELPSITTSSSNVVLQKPVFDENER